MIKLLVKVLKIIASLILVVLTYLIKHWTIGLHHTRDSVTNLKYKLCFLSSFYKENEALAFNQERCYHLVLCIWLIIFSLVLIMRLFHSVNSLIVSRKLQLNLLGKI